MIEFVPGGLAADRFERDRDFRLPGRIPDAVAVGKGDLPKRDPGPPVGYRGLRVGGSPVKHPVEQILRHCRFDNKGRIGTQDPLLEVRPGPAALSIPAAWQAGRLRWPHQGRPATADGRLCSTSRSSPYRWCGCRARSRLKTSRGSRDSASGQRKPTSRKRSTLQAHQPASRPA